MDASSLMMEGGGSSALPPKAYYFGDDVTDFGDGMRDFGDDVRDFDEFQRHMFSDEDDLPPTTRGRSTDLRSHLEDLANRHPEFADHLRSPPGWVNDLRGGKWSAGRSSSRDRPYFEGQGQPQPTTADQVGQEQQQQQGQHHQGQPQGQHDTQQNFDGASAGASGLNQHGLRNTVPDINSQAANEVRNQRSMSAPPDSNRNSAPQRFVSKIEINPVNPATGQTAADSKPPVPPANNKPNMQNQQPQHKTSTVRHIPIFVEGRDEPILPKNVDQEYAAPQPPQHNSQQWQQQNSQQWQQNSQPRQQPQQQFTSAYQPQRKPTPPFQGNYQGQQQHQSASPPPQQQQQQQRPRDQTDSVPKQQEHHQQQAPPSVPEVPKVDVNDPIYKVQCIQKEVDALKKQIEAFQGKTRADKEFIYLDEMLTRNLLKLDNISTEGKENIRAVRKEAINSVQKCISLLESKVPSADQQKMEEDVGEEKVEGSGGVEKAVEQIEQQMVTELGVAADGVAAPSKEENGPMEKVPKTEAEENPNEIKC